jgi:regulator of cell morphogenesis and NO signaling
MTIDAGAKVGMLAAEHPMATRVFARHDIDFCCGGGKPLGEVCRGKGLDPAAVIAEIEAEIAAPGSSPTRWDQEPLEVLIDHILATYHARLREELPRLESMARKVADVHHDKQPEKLPRLLSVYLGLKAELEDHMMKEETILFPAIRNGQGAMVGGPVAVMEQEHESAASALRELRELTGNYTVPDEACTTWKALWHGLAALESDLHEHIHLENNILFPRALAG